MFWFIFIPALAGVVGFVVGVLATMAGKINKDQERFETDWLQEYYDGF